jgi:hypothetical protein
MKQKVTDRPVLRHTHDDFQRVAHHNGAPTTHTRSVMLLAYAATAIEALVSRPTRPWAVLLRNSVRRWPDQFPHLPMYLSRADCHSGAPVH